jgi:2-keto-4-pentenoate hydratase/2-oxohepta-3-ene-1,7-dioic acid hydratase in catechol pathway
MRISRALDPQNRVCFAELLPDESKLARELIGNWAEGFTPTDRPPFHPIRVLAPVEPPMILALGVNYRSHALETGLRIPDMPLIFPKGINSVIGPEETILLPQAGPDEVDYEAELAIVIGKGGKNIPLDQALEAVYGYTCANDVSARDWQIRLQMKQWSRGKSFDTFCPLGPAVISREAVQDVQNLRIRAVLNHQTVQDSSTADMIFGIAEIVHHASRSVTLLPGTVILTGTPQGVGYTRQPPLFLKEGDRIRIEIEGIGSLENPVEAE